MKLDYWLFLFSSAIDVAFCNQLFRETTRTRLVCDIAILSYEGWEEVEEICHAVMLPDWMALIDIHEYWEAGGWQDAVDFEENVVKCTGPNI